MQETHCRSHSTAGSWLGPTVCIVHRKRIVRMRRNCWCCRSSQWGVGRVCCGWAVWQTSWRRGCYSGAPGNTGRAGSPCSMSMAGLCTLGTCSQMHCFIVVRLSGHLTSIHCTLLNTITMKSFHFMGTNYRGLVMMDTFVDTWIRGFSNYMHNY